ncbi:hypothetical protein BCR32DRAFT_291738 [Anaeromyces robustus]|uniref:Uncharacterized protein n=1 Tax=Anaeromyces robustus TaxID=1754192 RepID=A0A1Y1XDP3_9FUNG|nr:hypothetical protein BCR32DRAFT_291738 [Anaeromyces robustus]|eukprot:ORX83843.1 hypothetical protein BCR32DRAFT_291738 [Anaeromyces robustus]
MNNNSCHSACDRGAAIAVMSAIPIYVIIYSILSCYFYAFHKHRIYGKFKEKDSSNDSLKMYNRYLFSFIYITLLFTTTYASYEYYYGCEYCKDDICVPCSNNNNNNNNNNDLGTVIIPNKEGVNVTYISDTCSSKDIDLELCTSKSCTSDSECLSNKCIKGHCSFNEANPIVQCLYVRTVHSGPVFGDPKGYKRQCGLPVGDKCKSNRDCSSFNCEKYNKSDRICGIPDDSGCHSTCEWGGAFIMMIFVPFYLTLALSLCCCVCTYKKNKKRMKFISIVLVIVSAIPWLLVLFSDLIGIFKEDGIISGYIFRIIIVIGITLMIIGVICFCFKNDKKDSSDEDLKIIKV